MKNIELDKQSDPIGIKLLGYSWVVVSIGMAVFITAFFLTPFNAMISLNYFLKILYLYCMYGSILSYIARVSNFRPVSGVVFFMIILTICFFSYSYTYKEKQKENKPTSTKSSKS